LSNVILDLLTPQQRKTKNPIKTGEKMETTHIYNAGKGIAECLLIENCTPEMDRAGDLRPVARVIFTGDQSTTYKVFADLLTEKQPVSTV